jgi:hypothetical protein
MKILNRLLAFTILPAMLASCHTIKVQEIEMDYTQALRGNIKAMKVSDIYYKVEGIDTIKQITEIFQEFDENKNLIKQIDIFPNQSFHTTYYYYNSKELLDSSVSVDQNFIKYSKTQFGYNTKNQKIDYRHYSSNKLTTRKQWEYDAKGNRAVERMFSSIRKSSNGTTIFNYDYKKRFYTLKTLDSNNVLKHRHASKTYFNKRGLLVKTEFYEDQELTKLKSYSVSTYDKSGNLQSQISYDAEGKIRNKSIYVNRYDFKGNIIERNLYLDDKLRTGQQMEIEYL